MKTPATQSNHSKFTGCLLAALALLATPFATLASEADIALPKVRDAVFHFPGVTLSSSMILWLGIMVCFGGVAFGLLEYFKLKKLPAHKSMLDVSTLIYSTCRTYLLQQGRLLLLLELLIGGTMIYYFGFLKKLNAPTVALILAWSLIGIAGSFAVAWFGMMINNLANSRMAFAALRGKRSQFPRFRPAPA